MRTLKEIDAEVAEKSRARVEELSKDPVCKIMTPQEIMTGQCEARFGDKYREMYSILQTLEEYLKYNSLDGKQERQPLRKKLKEMLEAL